MVYLAYLVSIRDALMTEWMCRLAIKLAASRLLVSREQHSFRHFTLPLKHILPVPLQIVLSREIVSAFREGHFFAF